MAENLNVELNLRDVSESGDVLNQLLELSGDKRTPFLVDTEKNVKMYESSDIIDYLRENYAGTGSSDDAPAKPRVHVGGAVCESCEG
tara:strand:+ start:2275 stop:2535 length:261 start_codon:yes stop_codon:yes gene_type:complete